MKFSIVDQLNFAKLSQDSNPMHCDEVLARRYIFGEPVVHGINAMILAIKAWSEQHALPFVINSLRCKFNKPIYLQEEIRFEVKNENENEDIRINVIQNDEIRIRIRIKIRIGINFKVFKNEVQFTPTEEYDSYAATEPEDISFSELAGYSKKLQCAINSKLAINIYSKEFVDKIGRGQLAEIISYSRIIGMHTPGLNSIFSELQIDKNQVQEQDEIFFKVQSIDERFNIVNVRSNGPNFNASLRAFYRPVQVSQKSISQMESNLNKDEFIDFRALIIGGSRGLGEFTAKCLGYGGADILITYARGKDDTKKVSEDIKKYNKNVSIHRLDVSSLKNFDYQIIEHFDPTHIFYYATPFIFNGVKDKFCQVKYDKFKAYYVDAFQMIVENLANSNAHNRCFFYPSSVAVDERPNDMLEYTLAKKNGELLCSELERKYPNIKIYKPRLPRLETDQTVSLSSVKNEDPTKILHFIRSMKKIS